jgi:hypothetical protein
LVAFTVDDSEAKTTSATSAKTVSSKTKTNKEGANSDTPEDATAAAESDSTHTTTNLKFTVHMTGLPYKATEVYHSRSCFLAIFAIH